MIKKDQRNPHNPLIRDYFCICFFEIIATSRVIALPPFGGGEESPDSTEQCTGEEPGPNCCVATCDTAEQIVPQKMTSTLSLLHKWRRGGWKGENVR